MLPGPGPVNVIRKWGQGLSQTLRDSHLSFQQQKLKHNSVELVDLGDWGAGGEIAFLKAAGLRSM